MTPRERLAEVRTYSLIEEMLTAQGWDLRRPPAGDVLAQHEYKDLPALKKALEASGKSRKGGAGIPEYIVVDRETQRPLAVFEGKPQQSDLALAIRDVEIYGEGFRSARLNPVLIAVAGTEGDRFDLRVLKWNGIRWKEITYEGRPISWVPNREQLSAIIGDARLFELRPNVPSPEVLKARAEEINGLLREAGLQDSLRPAAIGSIMLALWKSQGNLRREPDFILNDINAACAEAFTKAGKPDLARSLRAGIDPQNKKLAIRAARICQILERLNITTLTAEHDYLGALYEEFFRYTAGNTIGQYFTPRHITGLMAELVDIDRDSLVLDPACGTGGFLIAAMHVVQRKSRLPRAEVIKLIKKQLIGLEDEPLTAALCVANMILRGDGTTGIQKADCFTFRNYPLDKVDVVLMNPPFPHANTDTPPEKFIDRALQALKRGGIAAIIVPSSLLVKGNKSAWRETVVEDNTLLAVISLPTELFQPYASSTTAILICQKGHPHPQHRPVFFCRIENDGFRLKKGVRVPVAGSQLRDVLTQFQRLGNELEFCASVPLVFDAGFAPGAYIDARPLSTDELHEEIGELIRNKAAFVVRHAPQLGRMLGAVGQARLTAQPLTRARRRPEAISRSGTIGEYFEIRYGQRELHSKEHLSAGDSLIISSSGIDNGCYGFFDFESLVKPPFVTVPSTGSIGEASVQEFPCGVVDDCLLLFAKQGTPLEALYIAAATLRRERWRFDYGRKITPERIAGFPLSLEDNGLLEWIRDERAKALVIEQRAIRSFNSLPELSEDEVKHAMQVEKRAAEWQAVRGN
ncbi:MAG: HsdM family class I SAM-dependent methyltransferase [Candidatus Binataceae bacterium]